MESLRTYLNAIPLDLQQEFATRCDTTIGYLRKVISTKQRIGEKLAIALERESNGQIPCEETCPDADWAYIRGSSAPRDEFASSEMH